MTPQTFNMALEMVKALVQLAPSVVAVVLFWLAQGSRRDALAVKLFDAQAVAYRELSTLLNTAFIVMLDYAENLQAGNVIPGMPQFHLQATHQALLDLRLKTVEHQSVLPDAVLSALEQLHAASGSTSAAEIIRRIDAVWTAMRETFKGAQVHLAKLTGEIQRAVQKQLPPPAP